VDSSILREFASLTDCQILAISESPFTNDELRNGGSLLQNVKVSNFEQTVSFVSHFVDLLWRVVVVTFNDHDPVMVTAMPD
jgi:pterin-4a-carbinolamine dehydratase